MSTRDDTAHGSAGTAGTGTEGDPSVFVAGDDGGYVEGDGTLWGHGGDDLLYGGEGNDTLLGGDGDDPLDGGAGDDVLIGGAGAHTFVIGGPNGTDSVEDFTRGDVVLAVGEIGAASMGDEFAPGRR